MIHICIVHSFICLNIFILSYIDSDRKCGIVNGGAHLPFFYNPNFFPSLPKSFMLSSYAEEIATQFSSQQIFNPLRHLVSVSACVIQFVVQEAVKSDFDANFSDCSNEEVTVSASSSPITSSNASTYSRLYECSYIFIFRHIYFII